MNFENTIHEIKDRIDIIKIISNYVILKKSGNNYIGLCPFHNEKIPSFFVNQIKGSYKCFGCGENGDIFNFLQKKTGKTFSDILNNLSSELGIMIEPKNEKLINNFKRKITILEDVRVFFSKLLLSDNGENALNYLIKIRKIKINTIKKWNIGFCPLNQNILIDFLKKKNIPLMIQ